ncbi:putative metalloprotease CJM1_0395 family protein [Rheinheimera sp.]|uniref:putative metalloprotease CJM1_0395 family protein n=1 Tax=Rheinheimera sp. TaxID=1869214 RepID=UPI003D2AFA6C
MAITSVYPNVTPYVGNPAVDLARRENLKRDIIEPVAQMERSAAEKGVISEDKSRNTAQNNPTYSDEIKNRGTELKQAVEGRSQERDPESRSGQDSSGQSGRDDSQQEATEQRKLAELKKRDAEVRAHEQAHASVGGDLAAAPSYEFELGPDGKQYAVGGEVNIDLAMVPGDPQATIVKMQKVRAAALAPADPSSADRSVASEATKRILQAQTELAQQKVALNDPPAADANYWLEQAGDNIQQRGVARQAAEDAETQAMTPGQAVNKGPQLEQRSLEFAALMQQRSKVISGFYQQAVQPQERPLLLTA